MFHLMRLLALALACVAVLSACSDNTAPPDPPGPDLITEPVDADELMAVLAFAHDTRDIARYRFILHSDYRFIGLQAVEFDHDQDLGVFEYWCQGIAGEQGIAFEDITTVEMTGVGPWQAVTADDPVFGDVADAVSRTYQLGLDLQVAGQQLIYQVRGQAVFYVTITDGVHRLRGVIDQTQDNRAAERVSWTAAKMIFY